MTLETIAEECEDDEDYENAFYDDGCAYYGENNE